MSLSYTTNSSNDFLAFWMSIEGRAICHNVSKEQAYAIWTKAQECVEPEEEFQPKEDGCIDGSGEALEPSVKRVLSRSMTESGPRDIPL